MRIYNLVRTLHILIFLSNSDKVRISSDKVGISFSGTPIYDKNYQNLKIKYLFHRKLNSITDIYNVLIGFPNGIGNLVEEYGKTFTGRTRWRKF